MLGMPRGEVSLNHRCAKCGSKCNPRYITVIDKVRFNCACGYVWDCQPLDKTIAKLRQEQPDIPLGPAVDIEARTPFAQMLEDR